MEQLILELNAKVILKFVLYKFSYCFFFNTIYYELY